MENLYEQYKIPLTHTRVSQQLWDQRPEDNFEIYSTRNFFLKKKMSWILHERYQTSNNFD